MHDCKPSNQISLLLARGRQELKLIKYCIISIGWFKLMRNIHIIFIVDVNQAFETPLKCDNLEDGSLMCSSDSFGFFFFFFFKEIK